MQNYLSGHRTKISSQAPVYSCILALIQYTLITCTLLVIFGLWLVRNVRQSTPTSVSWLPDARSSGPCSQYHRGRRLQHQSFSLISNHPSFLLCWSSSIPTAVASLQIWSVKALHISGTWEVKFVCCSILQVIETLAASIEYGLEGLTKV